ncbi:MAG: DUF2973 domain-containing protein [Leptolyngbyaceae cyanobacterium SL_7_1]|nr:DUF2973 domain-containing protein [Leptolyngbyaceae cyanobacterium SL_7_1]
MLHLIYILVFTLLAVLAVSNLIRNLVVLGVESHRGYSAAGRSPSQSRFRRTAVPHPELLDDAGNVSNEPLLVMRSVDVEDARQQLDALFNASPGGDEERD